MKDFLDYASDRYYSGSPVISDEEFDELAAKYNYTRVGSRVIDGISHQIPMWSLKKVYLEKDTLPFFSNNTVDTPKLDGAAISLLYVKGKLVIALTRGNGKKGNDITDKIRLKVPNFIDDYSTLEFIQVTGEIVAPKSIPRARNYAAGALNLKSVEEFSSRDLCFIAYGLEPYSFDTYLDNMRSLHNYGFNTVVDCDWEQYPQDGRVIRLNSNEEFLAAGYTSSHPKGAYAIKKEQKGLVTTLLDVVWQVGRTGVVSPVAILDPIEIDGATIRKATLHNIKYIRDLGLFIGAKVEVIRAGHIIPRVVGLAK